MNIYAKILAALLALAASLAIPAPAPDTAPPAPQEQQAFAVASVYDGDTLRVYASAASGETVSVRVLGINAPELRPEECYGIQSRDDARALLVGQTVLLQQDPTQPDKDRYGRWLRYVMLPDGRDFSAVMLERGLARVYEEYPVARTPDYRADQGQAQETNQGLWKEC